MARPGGWMDLLGWRNLEQFCSFCHSPCGADGDSRHCRGLGAHFLQVPLPLADCLNKQQAPNVAVFCEGFLFTRFSVTMSHTRLEGDVQVCHGCFCRSTSNLGEKSEGRSRERQVLLPNCARHCRKEQRWMWTVAEGWMCRKEGWEWTMERWG